MVELHHDVLVLVYEQRFFEEVVVFLHDVHVVVDDNHLDWKLMMW
jgi:hypothetical protein